MKGGKFEVEFLEDAVDFLDRLDEKARDKIIYNITKAKFSNDKALFKKLNEDIWEFRTLFQKTYYRLFAFWDTEATDQTLVIATHGLIKKTAKTPSGDLEKAARLRTQYFNEKMKKQ
jgi:phage-related protein